MNNTQTNVGGYPNDNCERSGAVNARRPKRRPLALCMDARRLLAHASFAATVTRRVTRTDHEWHVSAPSASHSHNDFVLALLSPWVTQENHGHASNRLAPCPRWLRR